MSLDFYSSLREWRGVSPPSDPSGLDPTELTSESDKPGHPEAKRRVDDLSDFVRTERNDTGQGPKILTHTNFIPADPHVQCAFNLKGQAQNRMFSVSRDTQERPEE